MELKEFYADSDGHLEPIPQFYRKSERQLSRANRKKSKKYLKGQAQSKNYHKARVRYAKKHLKVSRQREEYCKRVAYSVIQSNDLVAYEDLNVRGMIKKRCRDGGSISLRFIYLDPRLNVILPIPVLLDYGDSMNQESPRDAKLIL